MPAKTIRLTEDVHKRLQVFKTTIVLRAVHETKQTKFGPFSPIAGFFIQ